MADEATAELQFCLMAAKAAAERQLRRWMMKQLRSLSLRDGG
jgi:hypothetical protein